MQNNQAEAENFLFAEFRGKIRRAEMLSSSVKKLLAQALTSGVRVVVQNGRILKSGYEEGYFTADRKSG